MTRLLQMVVICALTLTTASALAQKRPYVPRWQGPYEGPGGDDRELVGLGLLGGGALASGLGLYFLESGSSVVCRDTRDDGPAVCEETPGSRVELGAGLLIGGVFLAGFGVYLIASSLPDPLGLDGGGGEPELIQIGVGVAPANEGAMVVGDVRF